MRDLSQLLGHEKEEQAFITASQSGRLHHGWLIEGPSGIGKAHLALRLAVRLLGGDPADQQDRVTHLVLNGGHPDIRYLHRSPDEKGKWPVDIPVKDARALNHFFELRPALGGTRVGIIDSLDELNRFGANALLKTLEEPPGNCVLLLIYHGQRPLLPTIRSRCRTLRLDPLSAAETRTILGEVDPDRFEAVAPLVPGRPGKISSLMSDTAQAAIAAIHKLSASWPHTSDVDIARFSSTTGADSVSLEAGQLALQNWFATQARQSDGSSQQMWSAAWLELVQGVSEARDLAMEPRQVAQFMVKALSSVTRAR